MSGPPPAPGAAVPPPFGRGSIVRTVVADPVVALLVQRALVMEVAHPAVARAVREHSTFTTRPWSRAWVTADAAVRLVFGDEAVARGAVAQIHAVHDTVHGAAAVHGAGGEGAYSAHDADLLTWVWATLVDTAETAYTRWVRPFSPEEAARFYGEMRDFARFFGIPESGLPPDRRAFGDYLGQHLADPHLGTEGTSRELARQVLWFRHWSVPPPLVRLERSLALATLDRGLTQRLGLHPGAADAALGRTLDAWLSTHYRRLPRLAPVLPALYVRCRRSTVGLGRRLGRA